MGFIGMYCLSVDCPLKGIIASSMLTFFEGQYTVCTISPLLALFSLVCHNLDHLEERGHDFQHNGGTDGVQRIDHGISLKPQVSNGTFSSSHRERAFAQVPSKS